MQAAYATKSVNSLLLYSVLGEDSVCIHNVKAGQSASAILAASRYLSDAASSLDQCVLNVHLLSSGSVINHCDMHMVHLAGTSDHACITRQCSPI